LSICSATFGFLSFGKFSILSIGGKVLKGKTDNNKVQGFRAQKAVRIV